MYVCMYDFPQHTSLSNIIFQQPQEENKYFSVVDEVHTNSKIISMAINPYFTNDAFILVEDGSFQCWADGHLSFVGDNQMINYSNENHVCWVNCIYGSNPRSILFLNSDEALLYDMRVTYFHFNSHKLSLKA